MTASTHSFRTEPLRAVVRPLDLALHEIAVELTLPGDAAQAGAVLALPAWTPGSYLIRDYARFLDRLRARDEAGRELVLEKLDKQRWRVPPAQGPVTVSYRLFCNDLTVRTSHVDLEHAHLAGAAAFLYLEDQPGRPYRVRFQDWPGTWGVACALPEDGEGFLAPDYDALVDSPFELGTFRLHAFGHRGCEFRLAVTGRHAGDESRIVEGTRAIVEVCAELFDGLPMTRYLFLLTFSPRARGGLEHRDSTSLLADPHALDKPEGYYDLFTLIAHEFFHVWNVKRLRDPLLGPFDYGRETPTRLLWFHEGCTSFMQYLVALRAGVAPWSWVAKRLAGSWTDNTTRAGRLEQSLEESSFDAWIRHYKPTEWSPNSTVSYYDKGSLVAWLMDAELRLASGGEHGLDRFFEEVWSRFGDGPVTDADLRAAFRDLAGQDPEPFWDRYIRGRAELDPDPIRRAYGLVFQFQAPWEQLPNGEAGDPEAQRRARTWAGLAMAADGPTVANVVPGSPAARAGLGYGMEVLAVDGWRVASGPEVVQRLGDRGPGERVEVLACDRGRVRTCTLTLEQSPLRTTLIQADPAATPVQREAFGAWTGQPFPAPAGRAQAARP
jgi:predicted metalloprotease with PDZ domain